ncbi:MAG TPA: hypothetical protein VGL35_07915 [Rhizomicrobium sp.]|jgi:hypothetical protein
MNREILTDRALLEIRGEDARTFLQGLITNEVEKLGPDAALYAALLTPQGKIVCDFFLYEGETSILLDCSRDSAVDLQKRLLRYKLRARVEIVLREEWNVVAGTQFESVDIPAWPDPRHLGLGWRAVRPAGADGHPKAATKYPERRLDLGIPEGADFGCDRMFALDANLEELKGVSFDKGCYVGQELTARMKHRGTARKKLLPVHASESRFPEPEAPVMASEREIGVVTAAYGTRGFALIRMDRLAEAEGVPFSAGGIPVNVIKPPWLFP